ncbi:AlpA family phage regulatory protein [Legionella pneumophila serogroup 1]|nr:AlpA family phage regulatory protein [Legionella pneumophila]
MTNPPERQLIYINELEQITGRSRVTLRRWWNKGKFPKPTKLHSSVLVWNALSIQQWINENVPETNHDK